MVCFIELFASDWCHEMCLVHLQEVSATTLDIGSAVGARETAIETILTATPSVTEVSLKKDMTYEFNIDIAFNANPGIPYNSVIGKLIHLSLNLLPSV